ncbi:MAG TPA: hypothetical protein VKR59_11015 [Terriglobales bacterium]|nr:hypothetical protein [Terriglobales bacterium]
MLKTRRSTFTGWADWQIAAAFAVGLRVIFSAIAAGFAFFLHPSLATIRSNAISENLPAPGTIHYALLGVWQRFDTLWYLRIAQHGYDQPMAVIFYPLYPAIIRLVSVAMPPLVAALLVSTVAAFFSFWGLLRLVKPDPATPVQTRTLLVLAAWPSSFVLFAGYAESLTLALIVWAIFWARKERWELAAVCGFMAGLCRPSGVLVAVPLFVLAVRSRRLRSLCVILAPIGPLAYWGWLRWSGRLSVVDAYRIYQAATLAPPWASLAEASRLVLAQRDLLLAVKLSLVAVALGFSLRRGVRIEDKLFALVLTLQMMMYTGRPLLGGPRYVLPMYPAFLAMGAYAAQKLSSVRFGFYVTTLGLLNLAWMWAFLNWSLVL